MANKENVRVVCRFRPVNEREMATAQGSEDEEFSLLIDEKQGIVGLRHAAGKRGNMSKREESHNFVFDKVFGPQADQRTIFEEVAKDAVNWIIEGYNSTIFAYGQTGTGKTYTMYGSDDGNPKLRGIIPRCTEHLFRELAENPDVAEVSVKCGFVELYKENLRDLLNPTAFGAMATDERKRPGAGANADGDESRGGAPQLKIRQSKEKGVYVQGLVEKYVYSPAEVLGLLRDGERYRVTKYTNMNDYSSRSHTLFFLTVTQTHKDGTVRTGKLNLVDLAGSENVSKSQASGEVLSEAQKINKSLSALGNVIYALTEARRDHVPYRDSKLTYLLQDSLGGNTKTVLIVTCSPHQFSFSETLSTLKFAKRAKEIKNAPTINRQESAAQLKSLVAYLEEQLRESERRNQELQAILQLLGIERDENGQYRIPKDLKGVASAEDERALLQAKAREVRLTKKLEHLERKMEKIDRARKKEQAYYANLRELFHKQRELAITMARTLKKRDETIVFLTKELDEYALFQAAVEEAVQKNPHLLAGLLKPKRRALTVETGDGGNNGPGGGNGAGGGGRGGGGGGDGVDYEDDVIDSPPSPEDQSEANFSHVSSFKSSASASSVNLPFKPSANVMDTALRGVDFKGNPEQAPDLDLKRAAELEEEAKKRRAAEEAQIEATKRAVGFIEEGTVFVKYPYGGGFMAKPSKKSVFYDKASGKLFYWDVNAKDAEKDKAAGESSKAMALEQITDIFIGKKTAAMQKGAAKDAKEECCFSVQDKERSLDFEAEDQQTRDQWVCAIDFLCRLKAERNHTAPPKVHGTMPINNPVTLEQGEDPSLPLSERNKATKLAPVVVVDDDEAPPDATALVARGQLPPPLVFQKPQKPQVVEVSRDEVVAEVRNSVEESKKLLQKTMQLKSDPFAAATAAAAAEPKKGAGQGIPDEKSAVPIDEEDEYVSEPDEADVPVKQQASPPPPTQQQQPSPQPQPQPQPQPKQLQPPPKDEAPKSEPNSGRGEGQPARPSEAAKKQPTRSPSSESGSSEGAAKKAPAAKSEAAKADGKKGAAAAAGAAASASASPASRPGSQLEHVKVRALYDFTAKSELQLSFKKGDILTVLSRKRPGWWDAQLGDKIGSIPHNYVKVIEE